jgi:signal transduction histidine kinase
MAALSDSVANEWRTEIEEKKDFGLAAIETFREFVYPGRSISLLALNGQVVAGEAIPNQVARRMRQTVVISPSFLELDEERRAVIAPFRSSLAERLIGFVVVWEDVSSEPTLRQELRESGFRALAVSLLLCGVFGAWLVRRSIAPIERLSSRVELIRDFREGETLPGGDLENEIGTLSRSFRRLLERMSATLDRERRFMADASHDLRAPVSGLRTEIDVVLSKPGRGAGELLESVHRLSRSVRRLEKLLDDIFLLSRLDEPGSDPSHGYCYLSDIVESTVETLRPLATEANQELILEIGEEALSRSDGGHLARAVSNIVENAIRHGRRGGRVRVALTSEKGFWLLLVEDDGPGIPEERLPFVFDRFYRGDPSRATAKLGEGGSSGLGLSIVKAVAESLGGSVEAFSGPERGTRIFLRIPKLEDVLPPS